VTGLPIPGGWIEEQLTVAPREFTLVRPHDPDAFLEEIAARGESGAEEPDPYWARLWPCAVTMAAAVLRPAGPLGPADSPHRVTHSLSSRSTAVRALEIGCGIGLVGLAALARGLRVTFSDHVPTAVLLALENARRNGFSARGLLLDWSRPLPEQYGVILGSDVIYDARCHERLLSLVERMLAPGGVCWLGDPGRNHAGRFVEESLRRGFRVQIQDELGADVAAVRCGHYQSILLRRK